VSSYIPMLTNPFISLRTSQNVRARMPFCSLPVVMSMTASSLLGLGRSNVTSSCVTFWRWTRLTLLGSLSSGHVRDRVVSTKQFVSDKAHNSGQMVPNVILCNRCVRSVPKLFLWAFVRISFTLSELSLIFAIQARSLDPKRPR